MQRTATLAEACAYLAEARNEINAFLGKQPHYINGADGYAYLNDDCNRLFLLQSIVGAPMMDNVCPVTLLDIIQSPLKHLTELNLSFIIEILESILSQPAGYPPLKKRFASLLSGWRSKIYMAGLSMGFAFDTGPIPSDTPKECAADADDSLDVTAKILASLSETTVSFFAGTSPEPTITTTDHDSKTTPACKKN